MFNKKYLLFISLIGFIFSFFACKVGDFSETVDYTITYYYNKENGEVATSSFTNHVRKGSYLEEGPTLWSNGVWTIKDDVAFGFIGDGNFGYDKGVHYKYSVESQNGVWKFKQIEGIDWDTTYPITTSLSLIPDYQPIKSSESVDITIKYYKLNKDSAMGYEEKVDVRSYKTLDISNNTTYLSDVVEGLELFTMTRDADLALGYMDKYDHNRLYYYDKVEMPLGYVPSEGAKDIYEFLLYDDNGNLIDEYRTDQLITTAFDGCVLVPKYVGAGYSPIEADDTGAKPGSLPGVEQVFIPGNIKEGGLELAPFPYTSIGSTALKRSETSMGIDSIANNTGSLICDESEYGLRVPDFYIMKTPMLSALFSKVKAVNTVYSKYTFQSAFSSSLSDSATYKVLDYETLGRLSFLDSMVLANMLTEYYNTLHADDKLSPVYYVYSVETAAKKTTYDSSGAASTSTDLYFKYPQELVGKLSDANVFRNASNVVFVDPSYCGDGTQATYNSAVTNKYHYFYINEAATGFRIPYDYIWEYAARIVTDERQIPNSDVRTIPIYTSPDETYETVMMPSESNGYLYPFQSAKGTFDSLINGPAYVGSGSGLALWNGQKYDKTSLRPFTVTTGRESNTYAESYFPKKTEKSLYKFDYKGDEDKNRVNGAGLLGMNGCVLQWTSTFANLYTPSASASDVTNYVIQRGGGTTYCAISNPDLLAIGGQMSNPATSYGNTASVRYIRYIF